MKFSLTKVIIGVLLLLVIVFVVLMWGAFTHEPKEKNIIQYHTDYHYILAKTYTIDVPIMESASLDTGLVELDNGRLTIHQGFAWNGTTGAIDTKTRARASLVHDALWQLMVHDKISKDYKDVVDDVFLKIAEEDGENSIVLSITKFIFKTLGVHFFFEDPIHYAA
jgi:hypothetical protein